MSSSQLDCAEASATLRRILEESIRCTRIPNGLALDTPYSFGDGQMLRVYLFETEDGIMVSDGGFAARQIETLLANQTTGRHYRLVERIAGLHHLTWSGHLSFVEPTLEDALYRLDRLALALHETELLLQRPRRPRVGIREYLRKELTARFGIVTQTDYPIILPEQRRPITVDILAEKNERQAAIEIIEARSDAGLDRQLDRSLVNLNILDRAAYQGELIMVFDEEILNTDYDAIDRFNHAKPLRALAVSSSEALQRVSAVFDQAA